MTATVSIVKNTADEGCAAVTRWVSPALVGVAFVMWLAVVGVFVTHPLSRLPLYFANRYLVLDATSMLFMLVTNTVFLGICVYLFSRERNTPGLTSDIRTRAALWIEQIAPDGTAVFVS